jgi:ubiquinone/menaquinone biosynthesis C-methylase UbiE
MDRKHKIWNLSDTFNLLKTYGLEYYNDVLERLSKGRILVVGSAVPSNISFLKYSCCANEVIIIDISMERLKGHIGKIGYLDKSCLVQMDARNIAISDNTIDLIICDYTLNIIEPPEIAIRQLEKKLKGHGVMLLMLATHPNENPYLLEKAIRQTYLYRDLNWKYKLKGFFDKLLVFDNSIEYTNSEMRIRSGYEDLELIIRRNDYYENLFSSSGFIWEKIFTLTPFRENSHLQIAKNFGFSVAFLSNLYLLKKGNL